MRNSVILDQLRGLTSRFYRFILKLAINAHLVVAYWRSRINRDQCGYNETSQSSFHSASAPRRIDRGDQQRAKINKTAVQSNTVSQSHTSGLNFNTPNSKKQKLCSFFRRLSLNTLMEYCVIALNEASSSSCSNKFDLTTSDKPVWLLGKQYELPQDADKLIHDIQSKIWITYRRGFPPIDEAGRYTTDRGFGCMIRCGQMVLANAFLSKTLGRDWRWCPNGLESNPAIYVKILKLFQDKEASIYSIHNITKSGQYEGKTVGEWFGPNTIAQALKRIATSQSDNSLKTSGNDVLISIEASLDNVVVIDEIKSRFKLRDSSDKSKIQTAGTTSTLFVTDNKGSSFSRDSSEGDEKKIEPPDWTPGLLFIQLRLGLSKINPIYFNALKKTFHLRNSLGIIGGRPNHALYLIGCTGDDVIYLDPHITQQYVDFDEESCLETLDEDSNKFTPLDESYHCSYAEKMALDKLDPSMALCFYFHTETDFDRWCEESSERLVKSELTPMFEITPSRPPGWTISMTSSPVDSNASNGWDLLQID